MALDKLRRGAIWLAAGLLAAVPRGAADAKPPEAPRPPADAVGDPIPPGTLARLGTLRLRHADWVNAVAFSPDGKVLATGSGRNSAADRSIRFWDVATGKELRKLHVSQHDVFSLAFSPDGKILASGERDGKVKLWEAATGKPILEVEGWPMREINSVAFSPDGKTLAAGNGHSAHLWDVATGKKLFQLEGHHGGVYVAFALDGSTLITGSRYGGKIHFWKVATGKELLAKEVPEEKHDKNVDSLAVSPDGKTVAISQACAIRLWDAASGREVRKIEHRTVIVGPLAFAPDGKTLLCGNSEGPMRLWDVATGREVFQLPEAGYNPKPVAFSPDGKLIASGGCDRLVRLWDARTGEEVFQFPGHRRPVRSVAVAPDGKALATAGEDGTVRLWDPAGGKEIRRFDLKRTPGPAAVAFAPDGKLLAAGGPEGTLRFWEMPSGEELLKLPRQGEKVTSLAFAPDGRLLAAGNSDKSIRLWDVAAGREVRQLKGHAAEVLAVAFAPDGKRLAAAGADQTLRLWDPAAGKELRQLGGQDFVSVAFAPDGRTLAAGGKDGRVQLWDARTGKELRRLEAPRGDWLPLAFSPDGKLLAAGGHDRTIPLWDVATGTEVRRLRGHQGGVTGVVFAPDGRSLISASQDTTALAWDLLVPPGSEAESPPKEPERLWAGLADEKPDAAYPAVWALAAAPRQAVALLKGRLKPAPEVPPARIARLIADLDSDRFAAREAATRELEQLGPLAEPALTKALRGGPSPEARRRVEQLLDTLQRRPLPPDQLRSLHAVQVLELIGSPAAERLLEPLAKGEPAAPLTADARAALARLKARREGPPAGPAWPKEAAARQEPRLLQEHDGHVAAIAFAPDGKRLASAGTEGEVSVADAATGKVVANWRAHRGGAYAVAFAPGGKLLASGGGDRLVRLWDPATGKELRQLEAHEDTVAALAFSPDGKVLASGGYDQAVRLWDVATGKPLPPVLRREGRVTALAFSPDGKLLASGGTVKTVEVDGERHGIAQADRVCLWEVPAGKQVRELTQRGSVVAFSADGKTLAAGGLVADLQRTEDGVSIDGLDLITVVEAATGKEVLRIPWRGGAVALSPDGKVVASGAGDHLHLSGNIFAYNGDNGRKTDHTLRLWETATGKEVLRLPERTAALLAFAPDGTRLAAATSDGAVLLWDVAGAGRDGKR